MRTSSILLAFWLLVSAPGCGGGGGGGGGIVPGPDPLEQIALRIVRDCAFETMSDALEILQAFRDVLDPGAGAPPILQFTQIVGTTAQWTLDLDGDGTDDFAGSVRFTDAAGAPIAPFDLNLLLPGTQRLVNFFVGIAPGTRVVIQIASAGAGNKNAQLTGVLGTGVVTQIEGSITSAPGVCSGTISFLGVPFSDLFGIFPQATFNGSFRSNDGLVVGTIALDGTNIARLAVRLNGVGDEFDFTLNLFNGSVN